MSQNKLKYPYLMAMAHAADDADDESAAGLQFNQSLERVPEVSPGHKSGGKRKKRMIIKTPADVTEEMEEDDSDVEYINPNSQAY